MKRTSKIIAVLAVLIAGSMIASGALLTYLSGTVTTTATVSSPMEEWISDSYGSGYVKDGTIDFPSVYGGETVTFYVLTKNKANALITGYGKNIVTNGAGLTGSDFSKIQARTSTNGGAWTPWYPLACTIIDPYTISFAYGPNPIIWDPLQIDITQIEGTFEEAAFGTYTFTSQIVP